MREISGKLKTDSRGNISFEDDNGERWLRIDIGDGPINPYSVASGEWEQIWVGRTTVSAVAVKMELLNHAPEVENKDCFRCNECGEDELRGNG